MSPYSGNTVADVVISRMKRRGKKSSSKGSEILPNPDSIQMKGANQAWNRVNLGPSPEQVEGSTPRPEHHRNQVHHLIRKKPPHPVQGHSNPSAGYTATFDTPIYNSNHTADSPIEMPAPQGISEISTGGDVRPPKQRRKYATHLLENLKTSPSIQRALRGGSQPKEDPGRFPPDTSTTVYVSAFAGHPIQLDSLYSPVVGEANNMEPNTNSANESTEAVASVAESVSYIDSNSSTEGTPSSPLPPDGQGQNSVTDSQPEMQNTSHIDRTDFHYNTLLNISNKILYAAQTNEDLRGVPPNDPQGAVEHLLYKYENMSRLYFELSNADAVFRNGLLHTFWEASGKIPTYEVAMNPQNDINAAFNQLLDNFGNIHEEYSREIDNINAILKPAQHEFPNLGGRIFRNLQSAFSKVIQEYKALDERFNTMNVELRRLGGIEEKCRTLEDALVKYKNELVATQKQRANLDERCRKLERIAETKENTHKGAIKEAKQKHDELKSKHESSAKESKQRYEGQSRDLKSKHELAMRDAQVKHDNLCWKMKSNHESEMKGAAQRQDEKYRVLKKKYDTLDDDLKISHAAVIDKLGKDHNSAMQVLRDQIATTNIEHRAELQKLKKQYEENLQAEKDRHETEEENFKKEKSQMEKQFETEKKKLEKQSEKEMKQLVKTEKSKRAEISARLGIAQNQLVLRDESNNFSDQKLYPLFAIVAMNVLNFSKLIGRPDWITPKSRSFPFHEQQLSQWSENGRTLKNQIVQNTVWIILFNRIYATPFRVFGGVGDDMDKSWISEFSIALPDDHEWPSPTELCEKKRSEEGQKCWEAITAKGGLTNYARRLSEGYENTITEIVEDIAQAVAIITAMDSKQRESAEKLVRSAAALWVELCSHKFRTVIIMPDEFKDHLASSRAPKTMKLLISPGLARIGDGLGNYLSKQTIVDGCELKLSDEYGRKGGR